MAFDLSKLTVRERQIHTLLREGQSVKETADKLGISSSTVKFHRNAVYRKLGIPFFGQRGIEMNYQDSLKDCEFNILLAIASFEQRLKALNV